MAVIEALNKLLGDPNEKELKKLKPIVKKVKKAQEDPSIQALTLEDLPKKTEEFKARVAEGAMLDDMLPEVFAVCVKACELLIGTKEEMGKQEFVWDMVPYDVQILGGIALHKGTVCEMKTGEGKTLVCTLPIYLNSLTGKGVHVVTVNDYLAKRDSIWMGMLYKALGLTVGVIVHEKDNEERREAYASDVTYGTNNEFGFDYLRDNMTHALDQQVQRKLNYAIVDEVDSILIDEARTPLIISQPADESTDKYKQYAQLVTQLEENTHYNRDEKQKVATLNEEGIKKMEEIIGVENIYTEKGFEEVHHIEQALRAYAMYKNDVDYVVKDGEVIIVDEFTGRMMPGRRYSHGLHQAIEAKERVDIQRESKTLATISFQNYFRIYDKLAGMTGTAKTEEEEFESIYKLRTLVIPTNQPVVRTDKADAIYRTLESKFMAVAKLTKEMNEKGQPVLIGTTSIEKSEALSAMLKQQNVPHEVLNAKFHEKEAEIVAKAGQEGAVTIATNMAGRGTDIKLGPTVADKGGLAVIGTERHEARRIDNQLRGRSGRQGDPGYSQFFVSMDDELMRLFGGDRLKAMMTRLKVPDDVPLENRVVSRSIESAQKRVEGRNFDIRKHLVQYDDVMNQHREIIYQRRQGILEKIAEADDEGQRTEDKGQGESSLHKDILGYIENEATSITTAQASSNDPEKWDTKEIEECVATLHPGFKDLVNQESLSQFNDKDKLAESLKRLLLEFYGKKCEEYDEKAVAQAERVVTLQSIDTHWMDHIDDMAHLREQVSFAGYAQRDPLIEYKDQGFRRFQQLLSNIESSIVRTLMQIEFAQFTPRAIVDLEGLQTNEDQIEAELTQTGVGDTVKNAPKSESPIVMQPGDSPDQNQPQQAQPRVVAKVGRNDPCPCGSGKKYKRCCGG